MLPGDDMKPLYTCHIMSDSLDFGFSSAKDHKIHPWSVHHCRCCQTFGRAMACHLSSSCLGEGPEELVISSSHEPGDREPDWPRGSHHRINHINAHKKRVCIYIQYYLYIYISLSLCAASLLCANPSPSQSCLAHQYLLKVCWDGFTPKFWPLQIAAQKSLIHIYPH